MINVQEIRRNVINVVKNYSDAQVKVRKATSNEPWGPSATLMSEIADLTYNVVAFSEIMQIIWKRLNDHGKNWRHVYKALVLLEYLIKTGSEKVAQQCRDNLFAIQTLKDFQYFEESKDQGLSIREKSKSLVNLLKDEEKLKVERSRALKAKERFSQSLSYMGNGSDTNEQPFKPSTSYPEALSQGETSRSLNSDLESARPHTVGEEKLQLEIALAMSKEEAEQEERIRKNDDLRLKLALEESEKNSQKSQINESHSAVDDLLSLNATPSTSASLLTTTNTVNAIVANDPWSSNCASGVDSVSTLLPSPPINKNRHQPILNQNDPWIPSKKAFESVTLDKKSSFEDPWGASNITSSFIPPENDPWSLNDPQQSENKEKSAKNDPWDSTFDSSKTDTTDPIEELREPISKTSISVDSNFSYQNNDITRRTPESFLGPNSNLVNLDALVSSKTQSCKPLKDVSIEMHANN
ncbi:epsin-2-like protein [Sarcoptes scabiei]|uniref:Epsin-2-like protein n=1 Tax=Sarcoptes scabiei TaxID=52283 RepID=A0A131ZXJ0_SARSC|nr:epsin-2-like protein [Sarcoptes scabiei]